MDNSTPHSANQRNRFLKPGEKRPPPPKKPKVDHKALVLDRLARGAVLLKTRASWTWDDTGGRAPAGACKTLARTGQIVSADALLPGVGLDAALTGQTWRLRDAPT